MTDAAKDNVDRKSNSDRLFRIGLMSSFGLNCACVLGGTFSLGYSLAKISEMSKPPLIVRVPEKIAPAAFATRLSVGEQKVPCFVVLETESERATAIVPRNCIDALGPK